MPLRQLLRRSPCVCFALDGEDTSLLINKYWLVIFVFLVGYGVASYQFTRNQLADDIDDYHREILVATRLLDEYSQNCTKNNFSPYVEHATSMYENLILKAQGSPYFLSREFIHDHQESVSSFQDKIKENHRIAGACKKT